MTEQPTLDVEWKAFWDNEAGPGWDWCVQVPGREPIMGLDEELAKRIVADHNSGLSIRIDTPRIDMKEVGKHLAESTKADLYWLEQLTKHLEK